ncbi:condensation domain-containing protein [Bacillus atrophaeus]|uniref:condensation domain-containing protein n=3 Tax=Bacillus atrophaeus TaxID=1452 RepID=UPI002282300B|nr:condensation domain-containing protein [Bacillus atrophaeus]MCY8814956.1 condensation domain-containing protein [Bacillus atrophaeus]MCY8823114.1 condensation domain-containing protein [Bacillus atrophaeus]MCY8831160.1 condensation domain-containing protein [Bacillus atrophaeus]MCY8834839.1 condensation domain-containing protein [Bacillus atrophaeus]MEC0752068.1 condensation domain-containing protein [Bacillus atrophaeus]
MNEEIAIIGMSGIFPEADNIDLFKENLVNGKDSVRELSDVRKILAEIKQGENVRKSGYLEKIHQFDYKYFNLSKKEADYLDPHQRLLLQLICNAIENSGYSTDELEGTNTSVILGGPGGPKPEYVNLTSQFDPTILTGSLHAIYAGRASHFLGLRGPAMMIDTACSSSLVAVHESCNKLFTGEADLAITGAVKIITNFEHRNELRFGIESDSNKCKAFDNSADGITDGEGGGILILKRLNDALRDSDLIHAVIKGSAINQDGNRSNGITAPSPEAQTEVVLKAWEKANIHPEKVSYIEAHGTGTRLGDPIEIQGLTDAFRRYTNKKGFCSIGSVKTNIGHLSEASGIVSMIKVILGLKNKQLFPSLHFNEPNEFINFEDSAVKVNTHLHNWESIDGKRIAGISSFGLSGTNAHLVLEEAPNLNDRELNSMEEDFNGTDKHYLVTLSAKTINALSNSRKNLITYLRKNTDDFRNISFVLNRGRSDFSYREAFVVRDRKDLIRQLESENLPFNEVLSNRSIVCLFSHHFSIPENLYKYFSVDHAICSKIYEDILKIVKSVENINVKKFIFQYLLYQYWQSIGIKPSKVIGTGIGNLIVQVVTGQKSLEVALSEVININDYDSLDHQKFKEFIYKLVDEANPIFLASSQDGELVDEMQSLNKERNLTQFMLAYEADTANSLLLSQRKLYQLGANFNWQSYYKHSSYRRIELPTYPFESYNCWINDINPQEKLINSHVKQREKEQFSVDIVGENLTPIETNVGNIWGKELKLAEVHVNDNFFDIGGTSLISMTIIEKIEQYLKVELDFDVLFEYGTVRELSEYIKTLMNDDELQDNINLELSNTNILNSKNQINRNVHYKETCIPLSFSQESMWYLEQSNPGSSNYNIPFGLRLKGPLNVKYLEESISTIVNRHESLRTTFSFEDRQPIQVVNERYPFKLPLEDLQNIVDENEKEMKISRINEQEAVRPFDIETGPLFRAKLLKLSDDHHILFVNMHHIISDNWSVQIFLNELVLLYQAYTEKKQPILKQLTQQYSDFAKLQRNNIQNQELDNQLEYWERKLKEAPQQLKIPTSKERPEEQSFNGKAYFFNVSQKLISELEQLRKDKNVSLYMTFLAAWKALLYCYTGEKDLVIGIPVAGRKIDHHEIIGNFVNTMALRTILKENSTFDDVLIKVKSEFLESFQYQEIPFNLVVNKLKVPRNLSYTPLFQVMFDFHHNSLVKGLELPEFNVSIIDNHIEQVKCDLEMVIRNSGEGITGELTYNTDIFEETEIKKIVEDYIALLNIVIEKPNINLKNISFSFGSKLNEDRIIEQKQFSDHSAHFNF